MQVVCLTCYQQGNEFRYPGEIKLCPVDKQHGMMYELFETGKSRSITMTSLTASFVSEKIVRSVLNLIPNGQLFTVHFQKKDGSLRKMLCQKGVKKHVKGTGKRPASSGNIQGVFDNQLEQYRCFDVRCVYYMKALGTPIGEPAE